MSSTMIRPASTAAGHRDALRTVGPAAAVYVGAWLTGLAIPVERLTPGSTADAVQTHYLDHGTGVLLQATLVHLVAGLALAAFTVGAAAAVARERRTAVLVAGLGAAVLSVLQWLVAVVAVTGSADQDATWSARLLTVITTTDSVKLVLLAALVVSLTRALHATAPLPRPLEILGVVLAVLLLLGAAALQVPSTTLGAALVASLVVLLGWVGSVGAVLSRRSTAASAGSTRGGRS